MAALPHGDRAVADPEKLTGYILNPAHRTGQNKARVFAAALGITVANFGVLRAALLAAADDTEAVLERRDRHGAHYAVEFVIDNAGRRALVRSLWTVRAGEEFPRLVSAFIRERNDD